MQACFQKSGCGTFGIILASIAASSIIEDGPGAHYTDLPLPTPGDWAVRATCTTPTASAVEAGFSVLQSAVV